MVEELEILKKRLPKGFTKRLAKEFNVTPVTVTNALKGRYRRFDIIERAVQMAEEYNKLEQRLKEVIQG
jgi:predicted transcriptional regulator